MRKRIIDSGQGGLIDVKARLASTAQRAVANSPGPLPDPCARLEDTITIKTILVYLDTEEHAADLIGIAASIAEATTAHLVALHVVSDVFVSATMSLEAMGEMIEAERQAYAAKAARIEVRYRQAVAGLRIPNEWRAVQAHLETAADVVMRHGRTADLIVLGQSEHELDVFGTDVSEEVMLGAGRPVLLVPLKGRNGPIGKRILIAWKDSREAARAVFDALPFLEQSDMVYILSVKPERRRSTGTPSPLTIPAADIAASLAHHDVRCEIVEVVGPEVTVADEILSQVKEHRCDMVVMGGYGHSRMRELFFGGTTQSMFDSLTVPVLMSH